MGINVYLLLGLQIIICSRYSSIVAKPLIGVNVRSARENEFPFIVSLIKFIPNDPHPERNHICTGSLITRRDVVLSAHCLEGELIHGLQIHFSSLSLRFGRRRSLYWWLTYEHWAVRKRLPLEFDINDVANLRLLHYVPDTIEPVPIPNIRNPRLYGKRVVTAGWGWQNNTHLNVILKAAELTVLTNDDCFERISRLANQSLPLDPRHVLCTFSNPHVILTYGDSGGPLLYRNQLVGINKGSCPMNLEEDDPQLVNLHMSIDYYKRFILETLGLEDG